MRFKNYLSDKDQKTLDLMYHEDMSEVDKLLGLEPAITELSATAEMIPQFWGDVPEEASDKEKQAAKIYNAAASVAKSLKHKFLSWLRMASQGIRNAKILVDVKSMEAFLDKVLKRGKAASTITDVLRSAILTETDDGTNTVVKNIKKRFKVAKYDKKEPGTDPAFGYHGSHHFKVLVEPVGQQRGTPGIFAEIQVMTRRLWAYKEEAHLIYQKYRSVKDADEKIKKMDQALSKLLFQKANIQSKFLAARKKGKGKKPKFTRRERKYKTYDRGY